MSCRTVVAAADEWLERLAQPSHTLDIALFAFQRVVPTFRMRPGRVISEHLLYFIADGTFEGRVADQPTQLHSGSLFLLPPAIPHTFWIPSPPPVTYSFRFRLRAPNGDDVHFGDRPITLHDAWDAMAILDQMYREYTEAAEHYTHRFRALCVLLSVEVLRKRSQTQHTERRLSPSQRLRILDMVLASGEKLPTPAEMARRVGLSPTYFSRLFTRTFGAPPRTWLKRERVRRGAQLLMETDLSVSEIAQRLGYHDIFLFSRQFKEEMGCGPTAYRKSH